MIRSIFAALLSLSLIIYILPQSINAQCSNTETDTDYYGNDITFVVANSQAACCTLCSVVPNCVLNVYIRDTTTCWLKSGFGFKLNAPGRIY